MGIDSLLILQAEFRKYPACLHQQEQGRFLYPVTIFPGHVYLPPLKKARSSMFAFASGKYFFEWDYYPLLKCACLPGYSYFVRGRDFELISNLELKESLN